MRCLSWTSPWSTTSMVTSTMPPMILRGSLRNRGQAHARVGLYLGPFLFQADSCALAKLLELIQSKLPDDVDANANGLTRLDKVVDMRNTQMSRTSGFDSAGGVDIALGTTKQNRSTVDVKKLEKQEAKTRAKLAKRAQRDLYESSKLVQQSKQQASYEELFLKVNPLESIGNKGKNKDIHLPNIDVNFGSNRILSNATLTIKAGRRAGLIGRNGVGKSTLLRNMALREIPIPTSISILYVEQEIVGDDTSPLRAYSRPTFGVRSSCRRKHRSMPSYKSSKIPPLLLLPLPTPLPPHRPRLLGKATRLPLAFRVDLQWTCPLDSVRSSARSSPLALEKSKPSSSIWKRNRSCSCCLAPQRSRIQGRRSTSRYKDLLGRLANASRACSCSLLQARLAHAR